MALAGLASVLALAGLPATAHRVAPPIGPTSPGTLVLRGDEGFAVALQLLVRAGNHAGALALLDSRPDLAGRADAKRLRAELLSKVGREREALSLLEGHLADVPDDALARFQLAELHFAAERDGAATLAYRLALAGDLDPVRQQVVGARLALIEDRRRWRISVGFSLAPDSNINGATDAARVDIFGLPFDLDDNARRKSGVVFSGFAAVERRVRLGEAWALRGGVVANILQAPGGDFDDTFASLRAGPECRPEPGMTLALQASANRRWFADRIYETGGGLRLEGELDGGENVRWSGALRADRSDVRPNPARDGWVYGLELARTRYTGPSALWRLSGTLALRDSVAKAESYRQAQVAVGRLFPLPFASLAYLEPYALRRVYDGPSAAFGETRKDWEYGATLRLSKRDWVVAGGFPFVAVTASRARSTIALNRFSRERVELGFTREF